MRKDVDAADRMLLQLSTLLRVTLAGNTAHEIRLEQELEILACYLAIEKIRFQDRLTVKMQIDPTALGASLKAPSSWTIFWKGKKLHQAQPLKARAVLPA